MTHTKNIQRCSKDKTLSDEKISKDKLSINILSVVKKKAIIKKKKEKKLQSCNIEEIRNKVCQDSIINKHRYYIFLNVIFN